MRRSSVITLIWLLLCLFVVSEIQAQPRLFGCMRSALESYPEAEKRPVIKYLDEARELADQEAKLFAEGRIAELYSGLSPSTKELHSAKEFRERFAEYERKYGKVLDFEYREQSLLFNDPTILDLRNVLTLTRYAVRTSGQDDGVVLEIQTTQNGASPVLGEIEMWRFDTSYPIEKRFPKATGNGGCELVRGPITVTGVN